MFRRRQEELRRQLEEIQAQKRKLLAPSSQQELVETQASLRDILGRLGVDMDDGASEAQSTPDRCK